jgi:DNA replication and repair protein RecF
VLLTALCLRDFRSYVEQQLEPALGVTMVVGANGAGKTNLLEGIHVATQGYSPRTRHDARMIRAGAESARVVALGECGGHAFSTDIRIRPGAKEIRIDGAAVEGEFLRRELAVLAFTPDRLAVVKGGPLVRRVYVDRALSRVLPARSALPGEYAVALAHRNAALRRGRAGLSSRDALVPWTEALARLGAELDSARAAVVRSLQRPFATRAAALGLPEAELSYRESGISPALLNARLARDLERGSTGAGPHLSDIAITAGGRDLRAFGSQGEQRLVVLALVLAEADLLLSERGDAPLLLLDDVLSELDEERRRSLLAELPAGSQTLLTATSLRSLPRNGPVPGLVVEVSAGKAVAR